MEFVLFGSTCARREENRNNKGSMRLQPVVKGGLCVWLSRAFLRAAVCRREKERKGVVCSWRACFGVPRASAAALFF